ncbi:hypothetical protein ABZ719_01165 [Streptomyces sp. NPDC006743]|uniref:hypothetical protein n=1 Tax=Streptomyces sp. NPDC006743 TaxID=3154480 RepID=UPI003455407B
MAPGTEITFTVPGAARATATGRAGLPVTAGSTATRPTADGAEIGLARVTW